MTPNAGAVELRDHLLDHGCGWTLSFDPDARPAYRYQVEFWRDPEGEARGRGETRDEAIEEAGKKLLSAVCDCPEPCCPAGASLWQHRHGALVGSVAAVGGL